MTEEENLVKELLLEYFRQRHECETWAYQEMERLKAAGEQYLSVFKELQPKLENIYNQFLTPKERKYTLAYNKIGSEPYFDPKHERIDSVTTRNKNRMVVRTTMSRNNSDQENEYIFLKKAGEWKLDNKKTYWEFKGKWESTML